MNGEGRSKTNLALNIGTMVSLLIAITVGGFIVANVYDITKRVEQQSIATGTAVNKTISQLLAVQESNNKRGNETFVQFKTLLLNQVNQGNQTLMNQQQYFPDFNESLTKISKALNITDDR